MSERFFPGVLLLALAVLLLSAQDVAAQSFEADYEGLVGAFPGALHEEATAEALVDQAGDLYDLIREHRRDNRDTLSEDERDELLALSREVRAFESVVRVVGQTHNAADVSIESFDALAERLGLRPEVLLTHESGIALVRIEVESFVSLLLFNPTATTFSVSYGVNDPERPGGVGSAACENYSVMSGLFNSRDRELDGLEFTLSARANRAGGCD